MSVPGPRGPIAMALALSLMAVGGAAGLFAVVHAMQPSQPTPKPEAAPAPVVPTATSAYSSPIGFRDPENRERWLALRPRVEKVRASIGALDQATAIPADDLEEACAAIFRDANPLAGESHKDIQTFADGAKRACDYDRSLALLRLVVRVQKTSPPKSKEEKRARCDFGARSVKRLVDRGYGDDEKAGQAIADVGRACL